MAWVFGDLGELVKSYIPDSWKFFVIQMFRTYKNMIKIECGMVRFINGKFYLRETETITKYYRVLRLQDESHITSASKFKVKTIDMCGSYRYESAR